MVCNMQWIIFMEDCGPGLMQKRKCLHVCHSLFLCIRHDKWSMFYPDCIPFVQCLETYYIVIFIYMLLTFLIIGYTLSENLGPIFLSHFLARSLVSLYFSPSSFSYPHVCCESMKNEFRCHLPQRAWMM